MEIKPPTAELYTTITRNVATVAQNSLPNSTPANWKTEQLIQALITKITDKQIFLDIQGVKTNTVKPNIADLQVGDILKLQIEQLKPMPEFKIISLEKAANTHLVTHALRQLTTQNTDINPLLKNISYIANRPALRPSPLAADVNAAVRDIFKQLPSPFNLKSAPQIQNQLQNSGIFIENKIKNQIFSALQNATTIKPDKLNSNIKVDLSLDLGAQLHRLANLIRTQLPPAAVVTKNTAVVNQQTTPQANVQQANPVPRVPLEQASLQNMTQRDEAMHTFLRQVESSLTHMQQTQLQNLNDAQPGRPLWLMELPIKNGQDIDLFELRISEEESAEENGKEKKIWNVTLKFDLTGIGKIKAHIKMQNDFVSAQFFSEKSEVLSLFQENFDFLRSRLNSNGLNVGNIECTRANLSEPQAPSHSKPLDVRT